jgi:hypothetical protein
MTKTLAAGVALALLSVLSPSRANGDSPPSNPCQTTNGMNSCRTELPPWVMDKGAHDFSQFGAIDCGGQPGNVCPCNDANNDFGHFPAFTNGACETTFTTPNVTNGRITMVTSGLPGGASGSALRIELHKGDWYPNASADYPTVRNEFSYRTRLPKDLSYYEVETQGVDVYLAFSVYFESSFDNWTCDPNQCAGSANARTCAKCGQNPPNVFNVFQQWHHENNSNSPPFGLVLQDRPDNTSCPGYTPLNPTHCFDIGLAHIVSQNSTMIWREHLQTNQWYNLTLHIHFDPTDAGSIMELRKSVGWNTPKSWFTLTCPPGSTQTSNGGCNLNTLDAAQPQSWFKLGHYRDPGIQESTVLWYAGVTMGSALSDVEKPPPTSDYLVTADPMTLTSQTAAAATSTITVSGNYTGTVNLKLAGCPTGATCPLSNTSIANGNGSSTLTLTPGSAAAGNYPLTVCGTTGTGSCPTTGVDHGVTIHWMIGGKPNPPISTLSDTFAGTSLDTTLWSQVASAGQLSEGQGSLSLTPNSVNGAAAIQSLAQYSLISSAASVNVVGVVNNGNDDQGFSIQLDSGNTLDWVYGSGVLYAQYNVAGVKTTATSFNYSPATHAWWRIREASGTVYWDTSPDGINWTNQASALQSNLFALAAITVGMRAETYGTGNPTPGTARYARFNGSPNPPTSSLADSFGGTSISTSLWSVGQINGVASENGTLGLSPNANSSSSSVYVLSTAHYTFNSSSLAARCAGVLNSGSLDQRMDVYLDGTHTLTWLYQSGLLKAKYMNGGSWVTLASLTYSAATHAWWRIREAGGQIYWETSADGGLWVTQGTASTSSVFSLSSIRVRLYAESYGSGSPSPGSARYADLNMPAVASIDEPFTGVAPTPATDTWTTSASGGSIYQDGTALNLAPNSNVGNAQLSVTSVNPFVFNSSSLAARVPNTINGAGGVDQQMMIRLDSNNYIRWVFQTNQLSMDYVVGGTLNTIATIPYSATSHLWLRLRESAGTTYWETSPDNVSWTSQGSISSSSLFSLRAVHPRFYAETYQGGAAIPGIAKFQALNPRPLTQLTDAFSGSGLDYTVWIPTTQNGTVTESGGALQLGLSTSLDAKATLFSRHWFNLSGSSAYVKVPAVVDSGGYVDTDFALLTDGANLVEWLYQSGSLYAISIRNGVKTVIAVITWSATNHLYWRIRESGGTTYWETSADKVSWTQQASAANTTLPPIGGLRVVFHAEEFNGGSATPGTAQYVGLNQ